MSKAESIVDYILKKRSSNFDRQTLKDYIEGLPSQLLDALYDDVLNDRGVIYIERS